MQRLTAHRSPVPKVHHIARPPLCQVARLHCSKEHQAGVARLKAKGYALMLKEAIREFVEVDAKSADNPPTISAWLANWWDELDIEKWTPFKALEQRFRVHGTVEPSTVIKDAKEILEKIVKMEIRRHEHFPGSSKKVLRMQAIYYVLVRLQSTYLHLAYPAVDLVQLAQLAAAGLGGLAAGQSSEVIVEIGNIQRLFRPYSDGRVPLTKRTFGDLERQFWKAVDDLTMNYGSLPMITG